MRKIKFLNPIDIKCGDEVRVDINGNRMYVTTKEGNKQIGSVYDGANLGRFIIHEITESIHEAELCGGTTWSEMILEKIGELEVDDMKKFIKRYLEFMK